MRKIRRSPALDVKDLRELLQVTNHHVRALIANDDPDNFLYELSTHMPRVGRHAPRSAFTEAL